MKRREAYEPEIGLNTDDAPAHYNRGLALYQLDRHDEALAAFEEAIRLNSQDACAHNQKGNVLHESSAMKKP